MSHTINPKPWSFKDGRVLDSDGNPMLGTDATWQDIINCVNGCAGLNPAAYRECVEAIKQLLHDLEMNEIQVEDYHASTAVAKLQQALLHATVKQ